MPYSTRRFFPLLGLAVAVALSTHDSASGQQQRVQATPGAQKLDRSVRENADRLLAEGRQIFRYDTFGSEEFWGGQIKLHQTIQGQKLGGVGAGVSPKQALELGLKVDMEAVPKNVAAAIKAGKVNLDDPANTLLLLKANAVVGV